MTGAEEARTAVHDLTPGQMRAALMSFWVKDPTSFWQAVQAATEASDG